MALSSLDTRLSSTGRRATCTVGKHLKRARLLLSHRRRLRLRTGEKHGFVASEWGIFALGDVFEEPLHGVGVEVLKEGAEHVLRNSC